MSKTVLITGGSGFLGRNISILFKKKGYRILGIGHDNNDGISPEKGTFDRWIPGSVDAINLNQIDEEIHFVIHCAGGSSVGNSILNPKHDFDKTVNSSSELLDYIRTSHPGAKLVYPSSAAVYGSVGDYAICEDHKLQPVSPYGFHKMIVEDLCKSYSINYGLSVVVIRFFSIYGDGLKKQLLWDACNRFKKTINPILFYGDGKETRDWIHVSDASSLIHCMITKTHDEKFLLLNGGTGRRITNNRILKQLANEFDSNIKIHFNMKNKSGDPRYYLANNDKAIQYGWNPQVFLEDGIERYVRWFKSVQKN